MKTQRWVGEIGGGWGGDGGGSSISRGNLSMVLAATSLFGMKLVEEISFLAGQHSHLLLHVLHLTPDLLCAALKPAAQL